MALTTPIETVDERPTCVTYAAGRLFYGRGNSIYFSQVIEGESIDALNKCYQKNDPTAEQLSDLLATDGGVLQINEAVNIKKLISLGKGIVIFADNGVWLLSGPDTGFSATNFFREQLSKVGCASKDAVVLVEDVAFFWSQEGIYQIAKDQFGNLRVTSISENIITGFYNNITSTAKDKAFGFYNRIKKQIEWLYAETDQDTSTDFAYAKNKGLIFDLRTQSFWPQGYIGDMTTSDLKAGSGTFIFGGIPTKISDEETSATYLSVNLEPGTTDTDYRVQFGYKNLKTFVDFTTVFPTAYLESGYETLDKPANAKAAPYATVNFRQTEQNFIADGVNGVKFDFPSSCLLTSKWDWNNTSSNGRWSPSQQAYRFRRVFTPSGVGPFDSGETVISTKNKILGRGKALSMRFEQEGTNDMQLLGWTVQWKVKGRM